VNELGAFSLCRIESRVNLGDAPEARGRDDAAQQEKGVVAVHFRDNLILESFDLNSTSWLILTFLDIRATKCVFYDASTQSRHSSDLNHQSRYAGAETATPFQE
jgi:hypothetical protein